MVFVGDLPLIERPLLRILDGQACRDDEDFAETPELTGLQDHAAEPRVDRETSKPSPERRQPLLLTNSVGIDGAELLEDGDAVTDESPIRWIDEGEGFDVSDAESGHLK